MKSTKEYFVYILQCSDQTFYTGITDDIDKRIKVHESGKGSKYVRSRLPVMLVYFEKLSDKSKALKREIFIKLLTRKQKENLIEGFHNLTS
jgi:putative endonuclease